MWSEKGCWAVPSLLDYAEFSFGYSFNVLIAMSVGIGKDVHFKCYYCDARDVRRAYLHVVVDCFHDMMVRPVSFQTMSTIY